MSTVSFTCGDIFPSGCVLFTGELPSFIDPETFDCDSMLDDVLDKYGDKIVEISDDIDLTGLSAGCFTFNPANVTIKELHQEEIDKICEHETRIISIEDSILNFDVSVKNIEIDLDCLSPLAEPCQGDEGPNIYTLLSVLLVLRSKICSLKAQLEECSNGNCGGNSCTSGTSGNSGASGTSGTSGVDGVGAGTSGTSGASGTSGTSATCDIP